MKGLPMSGEEENDTKLQTIQELINKMNEMDGKKFSKESGVSITISPMGGDDMGEMGEMEEPEGDEMDYGGIDPRLAEIIKSKKMRG